MRVDVFAGYGQKWGRKSLSPPVWWTNLGRQPETWRKDDEKEYLSRGKKERLVDPPTKK